MSPDVAVRGNVLLSVTPRAIAPLTTDNVRGLLTRTWALDMDLAAHDDSCCRLAGDARLELAVTGL
jgi:hypothetical protein